MSRSVVRHRALLVLALIALGVGATAVPALAGDSGGWDQHSDYKGGKGKDYGKGKDHGKDYGRDHNKGNDHGKDYGKGKDHGNKPQPAPETPVTPQPSPTPTTPTPTPATPVAPEGSPSQSAPEQPAETTPEEAESPTVAQTPTAGQESVSAAPAAEREELAKTGIDPGLIALFGVFLVGGGALLFRRALASNRE